MDVNIEKYTSKKRLSYIVICKSEPYIILQIEEKIEMSDIIQIEYINKSSFKNFINNADQHEI